MTAPRTRPRERRAPSRRRLHPPTPVESFPSMHDARFDKLAQLLVEYSTRLQRGENVLIEAFDVPDAMTIALVRAARKAGATPFTQMQRGRVSRELAMHATRRAARSHRRARAGADEEDGCLHRPARERQHQRALRRADGQDEAGREKNAPGAGPSREENEVGRAALAEPVHGAAGGDEHGGV